jgi:outer membrane protein assembly factor BamB
LVLLGAGPARAAEEDPLERALDFLVAGLTSPSATAKPGMANAQGKLISARALTAFILETFPDEKRWADAKRQIERRAARFAEHGASMMPDTWLAGFTALWLAEKRLRGPVEQKLVDELIYRIEEGQNREGGWAHGLNLPISFYPSTLIASSNWCLLALGLFRRLGYEVDEEAIEKGLTLYRETQGEGGAFPYGGKAYRKGFESGRTTGAVAALAALGQGETEMFRRAAANVLANPEEVPRGHASPAMHVLTGALAFRILGDDAWKLYDSTVLADVRSRQRDDGSLESLVGGSPDELTLAGGDFINGLYITACHAAALAMGRSEVARLLKTPQAIPKPVRVPDHPQPETIWSAKGKSVRDLALADGRLLTVDHDGRLRAYDAATGEPLWMTKASDLAKDGARPVWMAPASDKVLVWHGPRSGPAVPLSLQLPAATSDLEKRFSESIVCHSAKDGAVLWAAEVRGMAAAHAISRDRFHVKARSGRLLAFRLEDGRKEIDVQGASFLVNSALAVSPEGRIAVAAEAELRLLDPAGRVAWRRKPPRKRKLMPPAYGALAFAGEKLLVGRMDGRVVCLPPGGGEPEWAAAAGAGTSSLVVTPDGKGVIVTDSEGVIRRISLSGGDEVWSRLLPGAGTSVRPSSPRVSREGVLVRDAAGRRIFLLDLASGKVRAVIPAKGSAPFTVGGGRLFLADDGAVRAYRLSS